MREDVKRISKALSLNGEQFEIFMKYKLAEFLAGSAEEERFEYPGISGKIRRRGATRVELAVVVLQSGMADSFAIDVDPAELPEG